MGDLQQALDLLDNLENQIKESTTVVENEKTGTLTAINYVRGDLQESASANAKPKPEDIANLVDALSTITANIKNFTSKDPIKITQGVINIIGGIGSVVAGPYGPLVAASCGLISSILSLFGGGGPSLTEQLQEIIEQALEDFKDQEVYEEIMKSMTDMRTMTSVMVGMARYNGGIVTEGEKGFLSDPLLPLIGNSTLAVLRGQLDNYKTQNDDDSKCRRLAVYAYNYAKVGAYKHILLNMQIGLLRRNDMESVASGILNYLTNELPSQGKETIGFMSSLPDPDGCFYWRLFRYLHNGLNVTQRYVLSTYRKVIKLEPMPGVLCCLYNIATSGYAYPPSVKYDDSRRHFFRWGNGTAPPESLYRIVGEDSDHKFIYSVYYGEYVYAASIELASHRRYVFSWTPGRKYEYEATWQIKGDWAEDCNIRNANYNEYLFASTQGYDSERFYNCCWTPGELTNDARWQIKECPYETTPDLNKPMEK